MSSVELSGIHKSFGSHAVIQDLSLSVPDGSFCALLGPSGCGKSTLLRMIAGLEAVTSGTVRIGDRDVTYEEPKARGVAMVFQSYALYPHLTVAQNITFSLSLAGAPKDQRREAAERVGKLLQLDQLLDRRPAELSGGQRQRVAIGRALVRNPEVFLFDEPLSNLDALLRVQMRIELAKLHSDLKSTMIYVTHDQVEAMTLADRIVVLDKGVIKQVGSPLDLYNNPANRFVAGFIGSPAMNFLPLGPEGTLPGGGKLAVPLAAGATEIGIRPEHLRLTDRGKGQLDGTVVFVEQLGNTSFVYAETASGQIIAEADADHKANPGEGISLDFDPARIHLFDKDGVTLR
jgi:ABC-type sugar transport system ATPase subunit